MLCIDANVWVSHFDARVEEHDRVRPRMLDALEPRPLFCNAAIAMEVVHNLSNQHSDGEALTDRLLSLD